MRLFLLLILMAMAITSSVFSQESTLKLPTSDTTSSFNVTKSDGTSIFKVDGNGKITGDGSSLSNIKYNSILESSNQTTVKLPTSDTTSSFNVTKLDGTSIFKVDGSGKLSGDGSGLSNIKYNTISESSNQTTVKLPTTDNTSSFNVNNSSNTNLFQMLGDGGFCLKGTYGTGSIPATGVGTRLMWYPAKAAFRAGYAVSTYWNDTYIGDYSIAMGYGPRASGKDAVAIGAYNNSSGLRSLSLGAYCYATGDYSIALGTQVYASGANSIAMGSGADTNQKEGSVVIGDATYFQTAYASNNNQLTMRFSGGYRFWSSYPDSFAGVYMRHGQSAWSSYCDRNLKENFELINLEEICSKIKNMPVTKWNYKGRPEMKYIGPVSQDFYAAFKLGGTDSLGINSLCMDGVTIAGVKALIIRTDELKTAVKELKEQTEKITLLENTIKKQDEIITELKNRYDELKILIAETEKARKQEVAKK